MSKLGVVLQVVIVVMLAIIIALVIYYGTSSPKPVRSHMPPAGTMIRSINQVSQVVMEAQKRT
jgi:hypothetical protein